MVKFKHIRAKIKATIDKKNNKITTIKASKVADLLTLLSLFIIFLTTFQLNRYIGMYVLSLELLIISYFASKT